MFPASLELYLVNIMEAGGGTEIRTARIWKKGVGRTAVFKKGLTGKVGF